MTVVPDAATPRTCDIDPFSDESLLNPYPNHERVRELGSVVWMDKYEVFATGRYAEVVQILKDPETFCSSAGAGLANIKKSANPRPRSLLLEADPPHHTKARQVMTRVLTPTVVRSLREQFMDHARTLVAQLLERRTFDGVADLAQAYPLEVFGNAIGLRRDGRENLLPYAAMLFESFGPENQHQQIALQQGKSVQPWIMRQCEREMLDADGLGAKIHDVATREGYNAYDAARLVGAFLAAGFDTTVNGIGNMLLCLAQYPDQWEELKADPRLIRPAFEESIRYESPVQTFFRTTTRDTEVSGIKIPEGSKVLLMLAAANRDPRQWDEPDVFNVRRRASGHVGFGFGIHACLGQMIARLEGEAVLTALIESVETIELNGPVHRQLNNTLRGIASLPLKISAK